MSGTGAIQIQPDWDLFLTAASLQTVRPRGRSQDLRDRFDPFALPDPFKPPSPPGVDCIDLDSETQCQLDLSEQSAYNTDRHGKGLPAWHGQSTWQLRWPEKSNIPRPRSGKTG